MFSMFVWFVLLVYMIASKQPSDVSPRRHELLSAWGRFAGVRLSAIGSRLWAAILNRVPLGYQDETGFHFGVPPSHAGFWAASRCW